MAALIYTLHVYNRGRYIERRETQLPILFFMNVTQTVNS